MKYSFIETSAINRWYKENLDAYQLNNVLQKIKLKPIVGPHTLYELGRDCLLSNPDRTKGLFSLVKNLKPSFSYGRLWLGILEIMKLKDNSEVNWIIQDNNILQTVYDNIDEWCRGEFSEKLKSYINERQRLAANNRKLWTPDSSLKEMTFEELLSSLTSNIDKLKEFLLNATSKDKNIQLSNDEVSKFVKNIKSYPALRTLVHSHVYLEFMTRISENKHIPAEDRMTDSIQLAEASYCDVFITDDGNHLKYAHKINPDLQYLYVSDLITSI